MKNNPATVALRNMNDAQKIDRIESALRRLVATYVTEKEAVEWTRVRYDGRVNFCVRVSAADAGKVKGKMGQHDIALAFIGAEIGSAQDIVVKVVVGEPLPGQRPHEDSPKIVAREFDPQPTAELLAELLDLMLTAPPKIGITRSTKADMHKICFTIHPANRTDEETLCAELAGAKTTTIGALGTLFRAAGFEQGVRLYVATPTSL